MPRAFSDGFGYVHMYVCVCVFRLGAGLDQLAHIARSRGSEHSLSLDQRLVNNALILPSLSMSSIVDRNLMLCHVILSLFSPSHRLVTLNGMPGVGKTTVPSLSLP